ncbi:Protein transport protein sec20 [Xanthoria parietina]
MSVQHLDARLSPLNDAHKQTIQLIHRLSKHSVPLGSSLLNPDIRLELSTEIHQNLKDQEEQLELLRQEVEDQAITAGRASSARRRNSGEEREQSEIIAQVARLAEDLKLARSQFRKAQLQAKRSVEAAKRKEKELLFAGAQARAPAFSKGRLQGQEQLSKEQLELNASSDVTAALRRVHSLMQSEVSRSQFALETLHQSTAALSSLSVSYTKLDTLLSSSRSLVSTLLHSQKSDTWYLESAFWILVITISWLFFRRILYGPGWWLLYLPITVVWQAAVFIIQLFLGTFASAIGILGATKQSTTLDQAWVHISATSSEQPIAAGQIPTFPAGMSAPFIRVGGGGKGQPPPQKPQDERQTMSAAVGEMAEKDSGAISSGTLAAAEGSEGTVLRERAPDEPPNPKKRVWEENAAHQGDSSRPRDEL